MLARLTLSAARLLDVHIESSGRSTQPNEDEENALIVDLSAFRALLPNLHDNAWRGVAVACGRAVIPMCSKVHEILSSDLDNIAQLLLDLQDNCLNDALPIGLLEPPTVNYDSPIDCDLSEAAPRQPRKRRRSSHSTMPILIPSSLPSVPTIIITLCPSQPREMTSRLPFQDQAFGNLLTVPSYPAFNKIHPPMTLDSSLPLIEKWKWEDGHWQAVLPSIKEQTRKGMFARPLTTKRKTCRSQRAHNKAAIQAI